MSHRRIFRYLAIVSTAVLALVMWQSLRGSTAVSYPAARSFYYAGIYPGHVVLHYSRDFEAPTLSEAEATGFSELFELHGPSSVKDVIREFHPSDLPASEMPRFIMGSFKADSTVVKDDFTETEYWATFRIDFPLWFPWLVFITGAFVICRLMERRSARGMEKKLAETDAADRMAGDPS